MNLFRFLNKRNRPHRDCRSYRPQFESLEDRVVFSTTATMVKDINPPTGMTVPSSNPANLTQFNGALYFTAADATHGVELWKSDGTDAGTVLVRDIRSGSAGSAPANLTVVGSTLFFTADDGANGRELWKTDGTLTGTRMVNNVRPGAVGSDPTSLTVVNSTLFFTADDGATGRELWKSDGSTSGTALVSDVRPGALGSLPQQLTAMGSRLYFTAHNGGSGGVQLWKSDGSAPGTVEIFHATSTAATMSQLTAAGSNLYYVWDNDGPNMNLSRLELQRSDGTFAGTFPLMRSQLVPEPFANLTKVGSDLYFASRSEFGLNYDLRRVHDWTVTRLTDNRFSAPPSGFTDVNGAVFFSAGTADGVELWRSERIVEQVANIRAGGSSRPAQLTNVNGALFFTANDGVNGVELWQSDGTSAGTRMVRNINNLGDSSPASLLNVNGTLYFSAFRIFVGTELWRTRPNAAPTLNVNVAVSSIREGEPASISSAASDVDGDAVTFTATGLPAGLAVNPTTGAINGTAAYSAGRPTPYMLTITASDGFDSTSQTVRLSVTDVGMPTIVNPGAQGSNEGNVVSRAISASEPYGDVLTYTATGLPTGLSINSATGVISGTLGWQSAGAYVVTVTASDGTNLASASFTWTVGDLTPPVMTNPGPQLSNRGNTVTLDILASDPEADPLTFTVVNLPLGLTIDSRTGRISGTIGLAALARYDVTVLVSDGTNTTSLLFAWTVG